MPEPAFGDVDDLATLLDLEPLDRDLFRGRNARHHEPRISLYGGQVCAQALRAASLTVPDGRYPHSLHGYFLRAGRPSSPVIFHVDRDRDGGSFSARHVRAVQGGEVIFSMLASFHADEEGATFEAPPRREVPQPESFPNESWDRLVDVRESGFAGDVVWARVIDPFPDDRVLQTCAVAYVSDYGSGFAGLKIEGLPRGGPSIDHVVWFHQQIRVDDWMLIDMTPIRASGARGAYQGTVRDRAGALGAVIGQEMLLRPGFFIPEPPSAER